MTNTAYAAGANSITVEVRAFVASTGLPNTALAFNTSGLTANYIRNRGAVTPITPLVTQTPAGAWTSGGFCHLADGIYRLDVPNAAFLAGADDVVITLSGVADCVFTAARIEILGADPRSATIAANLAQINGVTITGNGSSQKFGV